MHNINQNIKTTGKKIRWLSHKAIFKYRMAPWNQRCLPDFIIVGAQKSGTTSLYNYLCQHPQLVPSHVKEVHYFDGGLNPFVDNYNKGETWYRAHFPLKRSLTSKHKTFEASPLYIFNPLSPERIYNLLPDVKIIALLRNPVDRAISHYFHEKRKGREKLSIIEALEIEEKRLKPLIDKADYKNMSFINHSYKKRGIYYEQLSRYYNIFPKNNILIIKSEKLFNETSKVLRDVFQFIEVDPKYKIVNLLPRNVAINRTDVDYDVYEYLKYYFLPHNITLYNLIGEDYMW